MDLLFYFDVVCPYAYLAFTQIERVAREGGANLHYRPVLLGGLFKSIGSAQRPVDHMPPEKVRMNAIDLSRWASLRGVKVEWPAGHPRRSVEAMRLCTAARSDEKLLVAVAGDLYRSYWGSGSDIADRQFLDEVARRHGIDPAAIDSDDAKNQLRATTDEALAAGAFGVPTFVVVRGERRDMFWGQDRLHFVEKALSGWMPPA
jgi:2-hydroxychromene-2-carboxylate isomerase